MSKTVDQRVVEMRFDNGQFERNVSTTMSTLDKLKQKLNLDGAAKGIESVGTAAKKIDMSGLSKGVDEVSVRFSALEVMGVTALANITNSAVNAGKRIASALTFDPIKTGLSEYETKINAIQVIQANTRGKNTMEDITAALDDLNRYADNTIYNFAQMTSNIGKFTAQVFDVQSAANAVKGMANLAAASGASAEDMARATYQMSQAMGSSIKLMDWNSLRNANMATQDLKDTLIALAKTHGIAIDDMIEKEGTFEYTLQNGWLTGEMFTEAMNIYSGVYSDAELKAKGFTDSQIANFKDLAATAESAATEVKTFTQLWDVLKETAQSGWTQTWELLFGDFDTSKKMFTNLQVYFSDIINGWSDARNTLLGGALNMTNPWSKIAEKLDVSGLGKIKEVAETVGEVTDKLEYFQDVVNKVWHGDYKNRDTGRYDLLKEAGYDPRVVQDLVNKGIDYKLTVDDIKESHKKFGLTLDETSKSTEKVVDSLGELSDKKLKDAGLTEAEIKLYRDLEEEAARTGVTIGELVEKMSEKDGRTMLIESAKNAWGGLVTILSSVKEAWIDAFPPMTVVQLYGIIEGINKLSEHLVVSEETAGKLERTFAGLFAAVDIITTIIGGGFKVAFNVLTEVLGYFNTDILDLTANVGDAVVGFRDWVDSILDISAILDVVVPVIKDAADAVKKWIETSETLNRVGEFFSNLADDIQSLFSSIRDSEILSKDIIAGLVNGLKNGVPDVWDAALELAKGLWESFCNFLGIESPSKKMEEAGEFTIDGLINGLQNGVDRVKEVMGDMAAKCIEAFKNLDWGAVLTAGFGVGMLVTGNRLIDVLDKFASIPESFSEMLESVGGMFEAIGESFNAKAFETKTNAILNLSKAVFVLVASVTILTLLDTAKLWSSIGALTALMVLLAGLTIFATKIESTTGVLKRLSLGSMLLTIAGSILVLAFAMKILSNIDGNIGGAIEMMVAMVVSLVTLLTAIGVLTKFGGMSDSVGQIGKTLLLVSGALLIMTFVIKQLSGMNDGDIAKGVVAIAAFEALFVGLIAATKLFNKDATKVGGVLLKMSVAILLMVGVVKLIAGIKSEDLTRGLITVTLLGGIFIGLIAACKLLSIFNADVSKVGGALIKMAAAMLILVVVIRLIGGMDPENMTKGVLAVSALGLIVAGLVKATSFAGGKDLKGVGTTLLMLSAAIGILAISVALLGMIKTENLQKGVAAVSVLAVLMSGMILATKNAQDVKGSMIGMAIAIGVMAAAVAALSFIDPGKLASATLALSAVMGAFALMIKMSGSATGKLGPLIVMTVAIGLLAGALVALSLLPIEDCLATAGSLSILLVAISSAMFIASKSAAVAPKALIAIGAMTIIVGLLGGLLYLMRDLPMESTLGNAAALSLLLVALAGVCALVSVIPAASAMQGALGLAGFIAIMAGVVAALGGLSKIDGFNQLMQDGGQVLGSIGYAIGNFVGSILGGLSAGAMSGLPAIGQSLSDFMTNIQGFLDGVGSIDAELVEGVKNLASAVLMLTAANVIDGLTSWLTGGNNLGDFANEIKAFVDNLSGMGTFTPEQVATIKNAGDAINAIAGAAEKVPNEGGLLGLIVGNNSLSTFATGIKNFVSTLSDMGTFTSDQVTTVTNAGKAIGAIAESAEMIPNEGGILAELVGDNSLTTFADGIKAFVSKLSSMGTFTPEQVATVKNASKAIKVAAEAANEVDGQADWTKSIFGDDSLATFAGEIKSFVSKLSDMGTLESDKVTTIKNAGKAIKALTEASKGIDGQAEWSKKIFGDNSLSAFAEDIKGFVGTIAELDTTALTGFSDALVELGESTIEDFIDGFTGAEGKVETAASDIADSGITAIENKKSGFKSAGKYVVEGFASGITLYSYIAKNAAKTMAKGAASAASAALEINSPSKVFRRIGSSIPEGFAQGIHAFGNSISRASSDMTAAAINSAKGSLVSLTDMMNSEVDAQPTISPVLDLSNVKSGASAISQLFASGPAVGVNANISAIDSAMTRIGQNGVNDDVVSELSKLGSKLDNIHGDTYSVNGITYSEGTELAEAIQTIIRFAQLERRV